MGIAADGRLSARERGYTWRWQQAAKRYLKSHPTCARAGEHPDCRIKAEHVDHIIPHNGNKRLMWSKKNWQPLCHPCHNRKTAEDASRGSVDEHGDPTDPAHHWNQKRVDKARD